MEKKLGYLFTYFQYPESIRRSLHSSNIIERMNKEIRRRIKVIDSLPTESAAMKIIYLRVAELNEKWSHRVIKGYYKCKDEITDMFRERYVLPPWLSSRRYPFSFHEFSIHGLYLHVLLNTIDALPTKRGNID